MKETPENTIMTKAMIEKIIDKSKEKMIMK